MPEFYVLRVWINGKPDPEFFSFQRTRFSNCGVFFEEEMDEGCLTTNLKYAKTWHRRMKRQYEEFPEPEHNWGKPELLTVSLKIEDR